MLYDSLVGKYEYTTQSKGSFWCHFTDTKGAVLLLIFKTQLRLGHVIVINVQIFVPFILA